MPRFSDEQLQTFYQEFEDHRSEQSDLHNELLSVIKDNTSAVASLSARTESIIEVWEASQGALKVLKWIGSSLKWISGVGAAALAAWYMLKNGHGK